MSTGCLCTPDMYTALMLRTRSALAGASLRNRGDCLQSGKSDPASRQDGMVVPTLGTFPVLKTQQWQERMF